MRINPLLTNELRLRTRNWRTYMMITLYLLILGGLGLLTFTTSLWQIRFGYIDLADVGRNVFIFLSILQFIMIYFIVPGFTSNAITSEKERQTFDLLVCTQLSPRNIVLGKLLAALSVVVLMIFASLPIYSFVFLLGGVTLGEVLKLIIIYLLTTFIYGSFYIYLSSRFKRSQSTVIFSYGLALAFLGLTLLLTALIAGLFASRRLDGPFPYLVLLHPGALFEILYPELSELLEMMSFKRYPFNGTFSWLKFWHISLAINLTLSGLSLFLATHSVNPLKKGRNSG